jgi:hypothetical protein
MSPIFSQLLSYARKERRRAAGAHFNARSLSPVWEVK